LTGASLQIQPLAAAKHAVSLPGPLGGFHKASG
jgi:hypothetical protein